METIKPKTGNIILFTLPTKEKGKFTGLKGNRAEIEAKSNYFIKTIIKQKELYPNRNNKRCF